MPNARQLPSLSQEKKNMSSLLPNSSSELEKRLSLTFCEIFNLPIDIKKFWQVQNATSDDLSYLAKNLNIEAFVNISERESDRRNLIQRAIAIFKQNGTPASLKFLCELLGFGEVIIEEWGNPTLIKWNGKRKWSDLTKWHTPLPEQWFEYRILIKRPVKKARVEMLRKLLEQVQPARCRLVKIITQEPIQWNGTNRFNREVTYGAY